MFPEDKKSGAKKALLSKLKSKVPEKEADPSLSMDDSDFEDMDTSPAPTLAKDAEAGPGMLHAETDDDLIKELESRGFKVSGDPGPGKRSHPDVESSAEDAGESQDEEDAEELSF